MKLRAGAMLVLAWSTGCTDRFLYEESRGQAVPIDRTVTFEGRFCTLGTSDVIRPIKIMLVMDASVVSRT